MPSSLASETGYPLALAAEFDSINVNADGVVVGRAGGTLEEVGLIIG